MRHPAVTATLVVACLGALRAVSAAGATATPGRDAPPEPVDPQAAQTASDAYAWRLFMALNRPVGVQAPSADPPAAWERWSTRNDLLRADGADPGRWQDLKVGATAAGRFEQLSAKDLPNLRHIEHGRMVAGPDPAAAAARLTEIRFNQAAYDYIRAQRLYNVAGQARALQAQPGIHFPAAAKTLKARWRPITPTQRSRYHTLDVRRADGTHQLYGLVALHIATKDLSNWFWATFEHEDNATRLGGEPGLADARDSLACPERPAHCTHAPAGIGLEGTVWSHYRLRGTMTRFTDAAGEPQRLANSDLEAGMQGSASCMTCHARAAVAIVQGAPVHLSIFDTEDPTQRRGFVGRPQAAWYRPSPAPHQPALTFEPLDFIWSLALLQEPQ